MSLRDVSRSEIGFVANSRRKEKLDPRSLARVCERELEVRHNTSEG